MRTQTEIIQRIKASKPRDMLGFEWQEYVPALTKESAASLRGSAIKEDADLSDWVQHYKNDEDVRKVAVDYMEFAWDKANNCRGISAGRSMAHYKAWLWLLGQDGFDGIEDYEHYGKDNLVRICEFLGLDSTKWDDRRRVNSESE